MRGMIIIQFNDFAYLAEGEHYMNEKQYLRANKRVFLAITIIFAYITLTMLAALAASHGDHFVRIMIQCLVSVGVIIISALGYLTRKKTHTCAIILTTAMMVGYAAVALLNTTEGTWAYALPLIIAAMVYLNERLQFCPTRICCTGQQGAGTVCPASCCIRFYQYYTDACAFL